MGMTGEQAYVLAKKLIEAGGGGGGTIDAYTKTQTDNLLFNKADKGTTLANYGITDGATKKEVSELKEDIGYIIKDKYSVEYNENANYPNAYGWNTSQGFTISNFIKKNSLIKTIRCKNEITTSVTFGLAFVDVNGKCLGVFDMTGFVGHEIELNYLTEDDGYLFIVVKNASAYQLTYSQDVIENAIGCNLHYIKGLTKGELPEVNNSYILDTTSTVIYPAFNVIYMDFSDIFKKTTNKYYGKKIAFLGDSLTAGYLESGNYVKRPYPTVIKDILKLSAIQNLGISNTTISTSGNPTNAMCNRYNNIDNDVDYICIMGGTNDHINGSELGSISDTTKDTFYGALYVLFNGIKTNYPNAKLIYFIPIQKQWSGLNSKNLNFKEYINAIKEMCEACSVEMLDLYSRSGLSFKISSSTSYFDGGLHLNKDGYEYLGKRIAELLLTI